ncbi:MAG: hypothetical protein ACK5H2_03440 [Beutenbergiaceae bacterium]
MSKRYWRPGARVYWRSPGSSQIGLDPRCAVVIDDLDPVEQSLLERLPHLAGEADPAVLARGAGRTPVLRLLDRLEAAGYLVPDPPPHGGADVRYWQLADLAGQQRPRSRGGSTLQIQGLDQVGLRVARIVAQAGVGALLVTDEGPVLADDLSTDGYRATDLGHPREQRALARLRPGYPKTSFTVRPGTRPDLVLLIEHGAADPVRARPLMREDLPHLPVLIRELDVVVGPLVRPGAGPCLRCLDLARSDADSRWPAVATQVTARPPVGTESVLSWFAASLAAHQAMAWLDGRTTAVDGVSLEVAATYPVPRHRRWQVHPRCGCTAAALTG